MTTIEFLSEWPEAQNWGFVFFAICFFLNIRLLQNRELMTGIGNSLFRPNYRPDDVNSDIAGKLFLSLQAIVFFSTFIYYLLADIVDLRNETMSHLFGLIALITVILILFVLFKWLLDFFAGNIFFSKEDVQLWNNYSLSILSLSGWVLFIPTVLLFYIKESYTICFYFVLIYSILIVIWRVFKIYTIFFGRKILSLHFILYLCAQEAVPLYLLYKALVYLFVTNLKGVLWLQV
ncbi:hypothetical protein AGMMS50262_13630 [Bacteroidia bacterium]|nr:hypothetical protein AGMMS50262_13630 [Bacteroidia bacterium]